MTHTYRNTSKSRTSHPTLLASAALIQSRSPSVPGLIGGANRTAVYFALLIPHHQHDHADHNQQSNDHCNKSDSKHLILPLSPAGVQPSYIVLQPATLCLLTEMPSAP